MRWRTALLSGILGFCLCGVVTSIAGDKKPPATIAILDVDTSVTFQTMSGWEFTDFAGQRSPAFDKYKAELFASAVRDLGLNRARLEVFSCCEHDADYYKQFTDGAISPAKWREIRGSCANDNDDAAVIAGKGFHWTKLDENVDRVVEPMRKLVAANGEKLWINACYVAFTQFNGDKFGYVHDDPDEYAEFVLATYKHLQDKYGWVPDSWEVILEPDNVPHWDGTLIGRCIVRAGKRLAEAGFTPRFVAPSISHPHVASSRAYIDAMHAVPGASALVLETSYHRYPDPGRKAVAEIHTKAARAGTATAQLEKIGATYLNLHEDLKVGHNVSWSQYVLATLGKDDGGGYYVVDASDPEKPVWRMGRRTRYLKHYFPYVRRGAVRIAVSSAGPFDPVGFVDGKGKVVVVVKATGGGSLAVRGLPPAAYGMTYSTDAQHDVELPDQIVRRGQSLTTSMPASGVMTIYAH